MICQSRRGEKEKRGKWDTEICGDPSGGAGICEGIYQGNESYVASAGGDHIGGQLRYRDEAKLLGKRPEPEADRIYRETVLPEKMRYNLESLRRFGVGSDLRTMAMNLSWKAREYGFHTSMIESSMMINDRMPEYCVDRAARILNHFEKSLNGSRILVVGVAYKQDIDDYRESPALEVIELLKAAGAMVEYYDPWIGEYQHQGKTMKGMTKITPEQVETYDLLMITAAHTNVDYEMLQKHSRAIFDTKNAMKSVVARDNIEIL